MKNQGTIQDGNGVYQFIRDHQYKGWWVVNELGTGEYKVFGPLTKGEAKKLYKQVSERKLNTGEVWCLRGLAILREEGEAIDRQLVGYAA